MFEEPKMEKLTINLPPIEIARMDMLIEAGYYPQPSVKESKDQKTYSGIGVYVLGNETFEKAIKQGTMMKIRVVGMLKLSEDVKPELIERAVDSVKIYGVVRGSQNAKKALERKTEGQVTK